MDIFEKLLKNLGPIGEHAERAHGYFAFPKLDGEIGARMNFRGKEKIIWSLNNYLGLANHAKVREVDASAAKEFGLAAPMGARMMSGNTNYHEQLENELSSFVQKEATILLNYGYQGILSAVDALCSRRDIIVYDAECHACIIDGLRLHPGYRYVFKHNDIGDCEKQLRRATEMLKNVSGGILLITEGVFGMAGDQGKLKEIAALKQKYDFRLLVDDAHGFGTMGKTGAGTGEEQGIQDQIDLYFSTFAKSMASIGAFMSGQKEIVNFLRYNMRSQIFAKSLPLPIVIGNITRLELLRTEPALRERLWENVEKLQHGLSARGFNIGTTNSPVTPIYLQGDIPEATAMCLDLRENYNIFCSIVVYPVIPRGQIIYRLIPTAAHTDEDITLTLEAFSEAKHKLDSLQYNVAEIPLV
ncbi:glycine C-acetyltransferase [Chitinophaga terrae (ex Kim and Jung 2007)]|uniref:Glycine C-acetyltransferase n=1 Tax=Chitinophaga terrae (ex Kim and Jung 2007) TaxID=408074 RepID=A0A1H4BMJ7_9BACT|nr:aminotransferase class I/II-fold pyridoxal phosphate-dependent enzyme [Chitinophaga terrae (ex Kim and Jung 2007)]MDQ0110451.1 glycine C-acetyltransferase [Chitinophaga terrae (ex Kim and Jung 2007)]GEP89662.1 8-amino-7-oxononanoate synthase [Chitinophaga terrae (ex Kim and Jung 2007)]SEA49361.1 glycine C-acetyltransferase [Chitinophaga terrae (ex Kim and Jung 2007)]